VRRNRERVCHNGIRAETTRRSKGWTALWRGALGAAALLLLAGCSDLRTGADALHESRGVLVDVQSREIQNAQSVTLREPSGALRTFQVSADVASNPDHPNTASHLRQHMLAGDPVVVVYRESGEGAVAVRILDDTPS